MDSKTLVIGATGFLGQAFVRQFFSSQESYGTLFRTERFGSDVLISQVNGLSDKKYQISDFFLQANSNIKIVNCSSSRYSEKSLVSRNGNFLFPKTILDGALSIGSFPVTWIQPESFWQYTLDPTPDPDYVYWKNTFRYELEKLASSDFFNYRCVVLPHLFGTSDNQNRFFPKLFYKLLNQDLVCIKGQEEIFAFADIDDVSKYLHKILFSSQINLENKVEMFPYFEMSLGKLVSEFLIHLKISPKISWKNSPPNQNPRMIFARPIPIADIGGNKTPLDRSLKNIGKWLSEAKQ